MNIKQFRAAIRDIYTAVGRLQKAFPGRKFTPDGRMLGDIGEAIGAFEFNVVLDDKSKKDWDGHRRDGKRAVQIKATQKDETYLKKPPQDGDLLVFKIFENGKWRCIYNGSILKVWRSLSGKKPDSTGAKIIKLKKLQEVK